MTGEEVEELMGALAATLDGAPARHGVTVDVVLLRRSYEAIRQLRADTITLADGFAAERDRALRLAIGRAGGCDHPARYCEVCVAEAAAAKEAPDVG